MWRKYDTFKPGTSFTAWGITIAHNLVLKFFEKNRYSKLSFSSDLEKKLASVTKERLASEKADLLQLLKECLGKLDPQNYELIRMRYVQKKATKEIADERGIALHSMYRIMGNIHEILHRCIRKSVLAQESI
jgi:RNA polymerase sigma-70 factor (ECF subfamily)